MKVTQEPTVERQTVLTIEVEPDDLEQYLERAYRRLVQRIVVPGFRKGKAPRSMVERVLGQETLLEEAVDVLLPEVVNKAIEQQGLQLSAEPSVEVLKRDPVTLKATVPLSPLVEVGDYLGIRIPEKMVEVTEEQVQRALEEVQRETAPWEPVERPVRVGDLLTIDLQGRVEGRLVFSNKDLPYIAQEDSPIPVPGFAKALEGTAKGATAEFTLPFPEDYPNKSLAGKGCLFGVEMKEIKERRLPDLNDEFAKGVGDGFETLEALKSALSSRLVTQMEAQARRQYEEEVVQAVVEAARIEVPPVVLEREVAHILDDQTRELARQRQSLEAYLESRGKTLESHQDELRPEALVRLKRSLVLRHVADAEGIQVAEEEVSREIDQLVQGESQQGVALRRFFQQPEGRASLQRGIRQRKVIEFLANVARGQAPGQETTQVGTRPEVSEQQSEGEGEHAVST